MIIATLDIESERKAKQFLVELLKAENIYFFI
jgi:hypothetical protein